MIGNDTPSSVRIRENQRRSRNQRKELIHDLQRRVQEYEAKGVAATQDMQRAARKVAEENLRLRSLLASRGVSQSEIVTYLQSFDAGSVQNDFQRHSQAINHSLSTSQQTGLVVTGPTSAVSVEQASAGPTARSTSQFATQSLAQTPFQTQVQLQQSNSPSHVGLQPSSQCAAEDRKQLVHVRRIADQQKYR
ncbi:bzip transcription factor [Pyrenophora seminiperda CCB06]|uniref:Bzip transcription factor n=1 Tax=Pyrenophora seminiperda CCB06 TaxID=1302712 RepID=A0A3M7MFK5_9PLEO|nr:bzip transcription factor [Pyrenophora seminiperda CCB06]